MNDMLLKEPRSRLADEIPGGWCYGRQSWHFHRRLWERYGVRLEYGEYTMILGAIRSGHAILLARAGKDAKAYAVQLRSGTWIKVLVGNKRGHLISALPWRSKAPAHPKLS